MKLLPRQSLGQHRAHRHTALSVMTAVLSLSLTLPAAGCAKQGATPPPPAPAKVELTLSAAASLADVLKAALPRFEQSHPGVTVHLNLGSSGALANQIGQGAPVDVFIAAGEEPMNRLLQQGLVDGPAMKRFVENRLVLVVPAGAGSGIRDWADLAGPAVRHIALANPAHVPAGEYGRAALQSLGLWDRVQGRLVFGEDVRQTLQFVETGEADAGLVYATDAATSPKVKLAATAPAGSHPPIVYPIARVKSAAHPQEADALVAYLLGADVAAQLRTAGFEVNR